MNKREIDIYLPVDDESGIILTNIALLKKKIDYDEVDVFFSVRGKEILYLFGRICV